MPRINSKKFYIASLKKHGITPQGLHWFGKESQEKRFDILLEMLPPRLEEFSLADAGCGFGDFYHYIQSKSLRPKNYIGIDSIKEMCMITSERTGQQTLHADICKEALPKADYYICSGAMNILSEFETYLFIKNCYDASKKAFLFNILHGEIKSKMYNYVTKQKLQKIAEELGVAKVEFQEEYMEGDISVAFFK
ncbi:MAG: class I SAM-dependent methyltransferase [Sulfurimonas sp.]|jgi:SAM-dependent methyltransferase|nr:class I SAM-dependent methyltransferase [Sulfurimonas sp.]